MTLGDNQTSRQLRAVLDQIAAHAKEDIPRAAFLKNTCHTLIEYAGCDRVGMVLRDRSFLYSCEMSRTSGQPFRYEAERVVGADSGSRVWTKGGNDILERLCDDIVQGRTETYRTFVTDGGSLWTGDVSLLPVKGLFRSRREKGLRMGLDQSCVSLALVPVLEGLERIGLIQFTSSAKAAFSLEMVESLELAGRALGLAHRIRQLRVANRERIKELRCLSGIAELGSKTEMNLDELLHGVVRLLPPAWLHPESAVARIVLGDQAYVTKGYRRPPQSMSADIIVFGKKKGYVEVGYIWKKPELDEGPFLLEERNLIDTIALDIAIMVERQQTIREKKGLQQQLLRADRLATVGQIGAGLAHELNEPLANILGFAQLAGKDATLSHQTRQDIERIAAGALYARDVIARLLVFARETSESKAPLDINAVVADSCSFMQSRCSKAGVTVVRKLTGGLPLVPADRAQLLQLLTNLAVNAIQAMADGGRLTLETALDCDHIVLTVEDTGCGMTDDVRRKIFDPFFTTKDAHEGTGLGLSVVHDIVSSHGGSIEVTSEVGRGSRFVVRFPVDGTPDRKE